MKHPFLMCIINDMNTKRFTTISIFAAIIIILQIISTYINFGGFPITLTLIPIIVAGAVYGPSIGALMGLVFGVIVSLMVIVGADPSGAIMFSTHPIITVVTCIIKGTCAGYIGALVYKLIRNNKVGIIISAIVTPITNTLILYISLALFFEESFIALIGGFMTINFAIELLTNVLIAPGLLVLINRVKGRNL